MFRFDSDPEIAAIMGGMYTPGSHGSSACLYRYPYTTPHCDQRPRHPDDDIAFQLPRETQDPRFEHWGAYVHGDFTTFPAQHLPGRCSRDGASSGQAWASYGVQGRRY